MVSWNLGDWINSPRTRPVTAELEALPVLSQGQADDLHYEGRDITGPLVGTRFRAWLARTGKADGEPYDNKVTVQVYDEATRTWSDRIIYDGDRRTVGTVVRDERV
jgi:hypothetical protein